MILEDDVESECSDNDSDGSEFLPGTDQPSDDDADHLSEELSSASSNSVSDTEVKYTNCYKSFSITVVMLSVT